jgi:hypothetical protein
MQPAAAAAAAAGVGAIFGLLGVLMAASDTSGIYAKLATYVHQPVTLLLH